MMRVCLTWCAVVALVFGVGCASPNQQFVQNTEKTWKLIGPEYRAYVEKDTGLSKEEKDDWKKLADSFDRLIEAAKEEEGK